MKRAILTLLSVMVLIALGAMYNQGMDQGMLIIAIFGLTARGYIVAENYRADGDRAVYDKQMKNVQTFTVFCVIISFFWPESMFQNAAILVCLLTHIALDRYIKS